MIHYKIYLRSTPGAGSRRLPTLLKKKKKKKKKKNKGEESYKPTATAQLVISARMADSMKYRRLRLTCAVSNSCGIPNRAFRRSTTLSHIAYLASRDSQAMRPNGEAGYLYEKVIGGWWCKKQGNKVHAVC